MATCGVELYQRSPDDWRARAENASKILEEFASIFGEDGGGAAGSRSKKSQKHGNHNDADPALHSEKVTKRKGKSKADGSNGSDGKADTASGKGQQADGAAPQPHKSKKRKLEDEALHLGGQAADEALQLLGFGASLPSTSAAAVWPSGKGSKKQQRQQQAGVTAGGSRGDGTQLAEATTLSGAAEGTAEKKKKKQKRGAASADEIDALFNHSKPPKKSKR